MSGKTSSGSNPRPGTGVFIPPAALFDCLPERNTASPVYDTKHQQRRSLDSQLERIHPKAPAEQNDSSSRASFGHSKAVPAVGMPSLHGVKSCPLGDLVPHLPVSALYNPSELDAAPVRQHRHSYTLGEGLLAPFNHFTSSVNTADAQAAGNTGCSAARLASMNSSMCHSTAACIGGVAAQSIFSPVSTPTGTPNGTPKGTSASGGPQMLPSGMLQASSAPMASAAQWHQQHQQQAPVLSAIACADTASSSSFGFGQPRPPLFKLPQQQLAAGTSTTSSTQQRQLQQACTGGYSSCQLPHSGPHQVQLVQQNPAMSLAAPPLYNDEELQQQILLAEVRLNELLQAGAGLGAAAGGYSTSSCPSTLLPIGQSSSSLLPMLEDSLPLLLSPQTASSSPLPTLDISMDMGFSNLLCPNAGAHDAMAAACTAITAGTAAGVSYCVMQNEQSQQQHKLCMSAVATALDGCGSCCGLSKEAMEKLQQLVAVQQLQLDLQSELLQLMPVA